MSSFRKTCTRCTSTTYCSDHARDAQLRTWSRAGGSIRPTRPAPTPPRLPDVVRGPIDHDATYDECGNLTSTRASALSSFIDDLDDVSERLYFGIGRLTLHVPSTYADSNDTHVRRALELVVRHTGLINAITRKRPTIDLSDVLQNVVLHLLQRDDDNDTSDLDVIINAIKGDVGRDDPEPGTCIVNGADVTTHDLDGGTRYHDHAGNERSNSLASQYAHLPASMRIRVRSRVRSMFGRPLDDVTQPFMNAWKITRRRVNGCKEASPLQNTSDVRFGMDVVGVHVVHSWDNDTSRPTRVVQGAHDGSNKRHYQKVARIVRDVVNDVRDASDTPTITSQGPIPGPRTYHGDTPTKRRRHARRASRMNVGRTMHARRK